MAEAQVRRSFAHYGEAYLQATADGVQPVGWRLNATTASPA
jgi:hypothetical protein